MNSAVKWAVVVGAVLVIVALIAIGCSGEPLIPQSDLPVGGSSGRNYEWRMTLQDAAAATGNGEILDCSGASTAGIQVSGTYTTNTVTFEGTTDYTNWVSLQCIDVADGSIDTSTTANGLWVCPVAGLHSLRARVTWTSGTSVTVKGIVTTAPTLPQPWDIAAVIGAGDNNIGNVDIVAVAMSADDVDEAAADADAQVIYAASGSLSHVLGGIAWSYGETPAADMRLTIEDAGDTVFSVEVTGQGPGFFPFNPPKYGTAGEGVTVTLTAGGTGITGTVSVLSHWTQ